MSYEPSTRVDRLPCYDCGSSDALSIYQNKGDEGDFYLLAKCFSCDTTTHQTKFKEKGYDQMTNLIDDKQFESSSDAFNKEFAKRNSARFVDQSEWPEVYTPDVPFLGIDVEVLEKYGVGVRYDDITRPNEATFVAYPYLDKDHELCALKTRDYSKPEKNFLAFGRMSAGGMFGSQLFKAGGKILTILEGEKDALAAFQMLGKRTPCISVKNGAAALSTEVKNHFEYINSFDQIRICMDPDEPGRQAVKKLCESNLLNPAKVFIVRLNDVQGDVHDYLTKGLDQEFRDAVWNAHQYTPEDIFIGQALVEDCIHEKEVKSYTTPWHGLNDKTFGLRKGELDVWLAETGVGKSTTFKHVVQDILIRYPEEKISMFMFEELPKKTLKDLVGLQMGRRLHLPNEPFTADEFREAAKQLNLDNLIIWGNFGSTDIDTIIKKLEYVVSQGCEFIFLDHLSMITADQRNSDERAALDQVINYLNNFVTAKNIHMSVIAHTNREGQIRGTAGIEKVAHKIIRISREKDHPNPDLRAVNRLSIEKNRFNGDLGEASFLEFSKDTGRYLERLDLDDEQFYAHKRTNNRS